jgi:pilus assembly protein Flp/PilA
MTDFAARRDDLLSRFCADETGATAIEYAMMAAGVALAVIAAVNSLGGVIIPGYLAAMGAF